MTVKPLFAACIVMLLTTPAMAQTTSGKKPLNLELPPNSLPAPAATAHGASRPAHASSSPRSAAAQPGMYYGDTSGRAGASNDDIAGISACDDDTYSKPQVHGSVGMGVMTGHHVSGNYQSGTVNITKAFGSCEEPHGGMSISVGVGKGHFNGPHRGH